MSTEREDEAPMGTHRDELLDRAVDYVVQHGLPSLTVRTVADAVGVAHNTITYHFGNRATLLQAIFERVAQRTKQDSEANLAPLDALTVEGAARARIQSTWEWLADPQHRPMWTTFFEGFALAIREPDQYRRFLDHLTADWVKPLTDEMVAAGLEQATAAARATMLVATIRGLVMELQAALPEDKIRITAAFDALLDVVTSWAADLPT